MSYPKSPSSIRRSTQLALLVVALVLAAGTAGVAQTEGKPQFGEEIEVSEVLLDVLVTDRGGNVIIGLTPEDFIVEEDGEAVDVASATFYSNRTLLDPALTTESVVEITPQRRYFILYFQEQQRANLDNPGLNLLQRQLQAARDSRKWIEDEMLLDDWVAVVSYDVKLKVHQDFTNDKSLLIRAVNNAARGKKASENWPSRLPDAETVSLRASLPQGKELGKRSPTVYEALELIAEASAPIVGRKNLIMFSTGFGDLDSLGLYRPDPRYWPEMVRKLNDANVAAYTVDLIPNAIEYEQADALHQLANETGGVYYDNFTSFLTPLQQLAEENSGYYLLSYRSGHPVGESGFQKVAVKTRNPDFKVRAREGYLYGDS